MADRQRGSASRPFRASTDCGCGRAVSWLMVKNFEINAEDFGLGLDHDVLEVPVGATRYRACSCSPEGIAAIEHMSPKNCFWYLNEVHVLRTQPWLAGRNRNQEMKGHCNDHDSVAGIPATPPAN